MMEHELPTIFYVKLGNFCKKTSFDENSSPTSTVTDDTCLNEIEDGLTETALTQIKRV